MQEKHKIKDAKLKESKTMTCAKIAKEKKY